MTAFPFAGPQLAALIVAIYSPYGTQMFFTCVACCRNQRPSACAGIEPIVLVAVVGPHLLHVADRSGAHHRGFLVAAEAPDRLDAVVLGQRLAQFRRLARHQIHNSARQIAGVEHLVQSPR
jgi:cytochrome c2